VIAEVILFVLTLACTAWAAAQTYRGQPVEYGGPVFPVTVTEAGPW
jgi:catalase (peroxidase I)